MNGSPRYFLLSVWRYEMQGAIMADYIPSFDGCKADNKSTSSKIVRYIEWNDFIEMTSNNRRNALTLCNQVVEVNSLPGGAYFQMSCV